MASSYVRARSQGIYGSTKLQRYVGCGRLGNLATMSKQQIHEAQLHIECKLILNHVQLRTTRKRMTMPPPPKTLNHYHQGGG